MSVPGTTKGKPKTKGQKQINEDNRTTLQFYKIMIGVVNVIYYTLGILYFNLFSFSYTCITIVTIASYAFGYKMLSYVAKQKFSAKGDLIDAGCDLNIPGGCSEHLKDLIIATSICQILSIFNPWFFSLWLAAPARVVWLVWKGLLHDWFFQNADDKPEVNEKKQRKAEKRMRRQQKQLG